MDYRQKEAAERKQRVAMIREWAEREHPNEGYGFAEWYEDTGRDDDYAAAYTVWLASADRVHWWAVMPGGVFEPTATAFARWYVVTGRTDAYWDAYRAYRALAPGSETYWTRAELDERYAKHVAEVRG